MTLVIIDDPVTDEPQPDPEIWKAWWESVRDRLLGTSK